MNAVVPGNERLCPPPAEPCHLHGAAAPGRPWAWRRCSV